jgi:hypothetical protein
MFTAGIRGNNRRNFISRTLESVGFHDYLENKMSAGTDLIVNAVSGGDYT